MTRNAHSFSGTRLGFVLWLAGMVGAASFLPVFPRLLAILGGENPPIPMYAIQAISFAQTGGFLALAVALGVFLARRVGLSAPAAEALVSRRRSWGELRPQILPGITGGIAGGLAIVFFSSIMLPYLPPEFVAAAKKLTLPLTTRLLYGGISEEILLRWGLMTLLVWLPFRFLRKGQGEVPVGYYWAAIIISAVVFGLGHLPVASLLSPAVTPALVTYVVVANALFGLIAGYLYWRRGLESAMVAHMVTHVVMVAAESLTA